MSELDGSNGVHESNGLNGTQPIYTSSGKKRFLTKDLNARIGDLDRKISALAEADQKAALSDLHQKIAGLVDQLEKLDERVTKIAHAVAQSNLVR